MQKAARIVFFSALAGFLISALVHGAAIAGLEEKSYPVTPFLLHLLALAAFGAGFVLHLFAAREIPPEFRANAVLYMLRGRPVWLLVLTAAFVLYGSANFLMFASSSTLRAFSAGWMLFFTGAMMLSAPGKPVPLPPSEPAPESFHVPFVSLFGRMMEGPGKIAYAWLLFLLLAFLAAGFYVPELFFISGFFLLGLTLNLLFRLRSTRFQITRAFVSGGQFTGELYRYNTLERFSLPLSGMKAEFIERNVRGNSLFELKISDAGGKHLFSQYSSKDWTYTRLKQLHDRLAAPGTSV